MTGVRFEAEDLGAKDPERREVVPLARAHDNAEATVAGVVVTTSRF